MCVCVLILQNLARISLRRWTGQRTRLGRACQWVTLGDRGHERGMCKYLEWILWELELGTSLGALVRVGAMAECSGGAGVHLVWDWDRARPLSVFCTPEL